MWAAREEVARAASTLVVVASNDRNLTPAALEAVFLPAANRSKGGQPLRATMGFLNSIPEGLPMNTSPPDKNTFEYQVAMAVTALAAALCKQPGIDGQKLRLDFLDTLEGIAKSPSGVETVGRNIATLMDVTLKARAAGID